MKENNELKKMNTKQKVKKARQLLSILVNLNQS